MNQNLRYQLTHIKKLLSRYTPQSLSAVTVSTIVIVCILLSVLYVTGIFSGILLWIFGAIVVALESAKYILYRRSTLTSLILAGSIASMSVYSGYHTLHDGITAFNTQQNVVQTQYENDYRTYQENLSKYQTQKKLYTESLDTLSQSIVYNTSRTDRNRITDERIQQDTEQYNRLSEKLSSMEVPQEPARPVYRQISERFAYLAWLIEIVGFYLVSRIGRQKTRPVRQVKTKTAKTKSKTQKPVRQKSKTSKTQRFSIVRELQLTEAQRVKLCRFAQKRQIPWTEFNRPKYIPMAKKHLGIE